MLGKRISEEVQRRLQRCSDRLARDLRLGAQETLIVRAVLQGACNWVLSTGCANCRCYPRLRSSTCKRNSQICRARTEIAGRHGQGRPQRTTGHPVAQQPLTGYDRTLRPPAPSYRAADSSHPVPCHSGCTPQAQHPELTIASMSDTAEFKATLTRYLKARIPFISIRSAERSRVLELLRDVGSTLQAPIYVHTLSQGTRASLAATAPSTTTAP
jgi:hypothetical protein